MQRTYVENMTCRLPLDVSWALVALCALKLFPGKIKLSYMHSVIRVKYTFQCTN